MAQVIYLKTKANTPWLPWINQPCIGVARDQRKQIYSRLAQVIYLKGKANTPCLPWISQPGLGVARDQSKQSCFHIDPFDVLSVRLSAAVAA
jgi:hypothetical protein